MEFEFDKEMDAILQKTRHTESVAAGSPHLDVDEISAFAENALPDLTRVQYVQHLADCDRCRKHLSRTISISDGAVVTAAVLPDLAPAAEASVPWYSSIFRTPNLAIAMGGLVLVFSGVLGFLLLQNNREAQNAVVSQVTEQEAQSAAPSFAENADQSNANAIAYAAPQQLAVANTATNTAANSATNTSPVTTAGGDLRKSVAEADAPTADLNITARQLNELPRAAAPPPALKPPAGVTVDADEAKKDAETRQAELSDESLALKRKETDSSRARDLPAAAAKKGPGRSGPVQMQSNQNARNAVQMSVTRSVGGRKFTNRDGAWYDTAYNNQATTNVRRDTEDFKKLDAGLRSIANQIEGVVVVIWKNKAFRIQ